MNHIGRDGVSPVHVSPDGGVRVVLEEHVVVALPVNGTVGIVHPVGCRKQVELRAQRIGGERFGGRIGNRFREDREGRSGGDHVLQEATAVRPLGSMPEDTEWRRNIFPIIHEGVPLRMEIRLGTVLTTCGHSNCNWLCVGFLVFRSSSVTKYH